MLTMHPDARLKSLQDRAMKVNGLNEIKASSLSRKKKAGNGGTAFSVGNGTESAEAAHARPPISLTAIDSLLSLQEIESRSYSPAQKGHMTLDLLDEIRHGLLLGAVSVAKLKALKSLIQEERGQTSDPKLAAVLDEIDLRAQVELAKYEERIP